MEKAIKTVVNGGGLYVATLLVKPGLEFRGGGAGLVAAVLLVTLVFGLLNTYNMTLVERRHWNVSWALTGLGTFVVNALMLWLISTASGHLTVGFHIENVFFALIGGVVATTASLILHSLLPPAAVAHA